MTDRSFSVFEDEAKQWLAHEQDGGTFVLILSLSTGSTRCVGPIGSFIDAMAAAATVIGDDIELPPELALSVSIAPLFAPGQ